MLDAGHRLGVEAAEFKSHTQRDTRLYEQLSVYCFTYGLIALLMTLFLAMVPYLHLSSISDERGARITIPLVFSYVSAFTVVFFAYLTHVAFRSMLNKHDAKRVAQRAIRDAEFAVKWANQTLNTVNEEKPANPGAGGFSL